MTRALLVMVLVAAPARAGVYYSGEAFRDLPARWAGYLPDHRLLRSVGVTDPRGLTPTPPLRDAYVDSLQKLEAAAKAGDLSADDAADLGALHLRLGQPAKALAVLRPAARRHPEHFRLAANLGTAWQLNGDLGQAVASFEEAVRLAPAPLRAVESLHRRLVQSRRRETSKSALDDLFGVAFVGESGAPEAGKLAAAGAKTLPADALALVQQLALALPNDGRLLWQLGELANASGDVRTAANLLDGCVGEFALAGDDVRRRREVYRAAAEALDAANKTAEPKGVTFRSARALKRSLDPARLPKVKPDGVNGLVWAALTETEYGPRGKPTFLKYLDELDGKRVSVTGFMAPGAGGRGDDLANFILTENPVGCWFCETPGPTQVLVVELAAGLTAEPTRQVVKITGTLKLNRTDPEQYPFTLTGAKLSAAD